MLTLEQKLRAFEQTISARAADAAGCRDESARNAAALQAEISNIIFFSNRYALHFAGNVGLALLKSGQADEKSMLSFGYAND